MSFTISNLITVKIVDLGVFNLITPAAAIIYPLIYVLTNVITQAYGEDAAQRTLVLGILADVLFVCMTSLLLILPSPANYTGDSALAFVFMKTPRILVASYISYLIGNIVNAHLTVKLKNGCSNATLRNMLAIAIGELLGNIMFITLAFIFEVSFSEIIVMIFTHWILTLIWIVIAQPFIPRLLNWVSSDKVE